MDLTNRLKNITSRPGCYLMYNQEGEVIYIGKAKNLGNRIRSYFTGVHDIKTTKMVENIANFEYIITSSETEAFILEMNLIKKHRPKYNILFIDDKKYPYICITEEEYPRLLFTRDITKKGKYFGPYPYANAAKEIVELLNRIYPLRKCRVIPKKECLYYHLGQCLAPCIKEVPNEEYNALLNEIISFLNGDTKRIQKDLLIKMDDAAESLQFEKAMEYRDLLEGLKIITEKQKMEFDSKDTDVFAYYVENNYIVIQVFLIRGQKTVATKDYLFEVMGTPEEMFINFIGQFYLIHNNPFPVEILLPLVDISSIDDILKKRIIIPKRGQKKRYVELVQENAREKLDYMIRIEKNRYEKTLGAIFKLGEILNINPPHNIEAFDVSNIQGAFSVGAMVVYNDGVPNRKKYRKYKIKTVIGPDDVGSVFEIVSRRYQFLKQSKQSFPDLIIVDGGKNQVNAALSALQKLGLSINVLGLGKDNNHKTSYLFFAGKRIDLNKRSNLFFFLENLQDEVHRFAITFFQRTHSKQTLSSKLDEIKGIGSVKKKQIIEVLRRKNYSNFEDELREIKLTEEQINEIKKVV